MTVNNPAAVTAAKLRSGSPDALASLCDSRGAAVLNYCEQVVGRDDAVEVAADAFAQVRLAILSASSLTSKEQAEELLRSVTRRTALSRVVEPTGDRRGGSQPTACDGRETELMGYLEKTLTAADRAAVAAHLGHCHGCASALRRLEAAEDAFSLKSGSRLPRPAAREILTALASAAPVSAHGGDAIAVRDEALSLLDPGGEETTATRGEPTRPLADPPVEARDAGDEEAPKAPVAHAPAASSAPSQFPTWQREAAPWPAEQDSLAHVRGWLPWSRRERFGPRRSAILLRGAARLAAVVALAGAAGTLLGVGIAALTGGDATSSSKLPTASAPSPTNSAPRPRMSTPPAASSDLPVEVLRTTVKPATDGGARAAQVRVRVRVENAGGRTVRTRRPELLVDDVRIALKADTTGISGGLLARKLAPGAAAEGTLRFDLPTTVASGLTTARVRLRVLGQIVVLTLKG